MEIKKNTREAGQWIASLFVLVAGIVLVFINLFQIPVGKIDGSVLGAFGMFLGFVGAVWQIDIKYSFKQNELESRMARKDSEDGKPETE